MSQSREVSDVVEPSDHAVAIVHSSAVVRAGLQCMLDEIDVFSTVWTKASLSEEGLLADDAVNTSVAMIQCPLDTGGCEWGAPDRCVKDFAAAGGEVWLLIPSVSASCLAAAARLPYHGLLVEVEIEPEDLREAFGPRGRARTPASARLIRSLVGLQLHGDGACRRSLSSGLTPREYETLVLLAGGLSNRLVARRMGISEHGAKRLVGNVLSKTNSPNRTSAVRLAIAEGLIDPVGTD